MSTKILMKNVTKTFIINGETLPTLGGISLQVEACEFVSIIGPSGCGKSTIFNIASGLVNPDSGRVVLNGSPETSPSQVISYMPQKDLLLPWRNILKNVILARKVQGVDIKKAEKEAQELMPLFGLEGFEKSYPAELSGGMRQRAALMRTVLARREVLLLDEPFGALDAITRATMQGWLLDVWSTFRYAICFITHDVEEALFLSDRIYVLSPRPARIHLHLKVDLPRPRYRRMVTERHFLDLKNKVMDALHIV